ncbi:MAG: hypothetical protein HC800_13195 [Phormidesmis sp. RL_2_1]|nr:hypothetical protein [Phormidesmis sp. RL_2_1]
MEMGTSRIRDIVLSLRNFARLDESAMKQAAVEQGLDSTLLILQNRLGLQSFRPAIEMIKHYGNLPPIECYPGQLNQVFLNILANAIDAIDEMSRQRDLKAWQPRIILRTELQADQVVIVMSDNGGGMAADVQAHIFDPFFTTKPVGQGTGMGLAISHKIVSDQHKGSLICQSELGEGTTFVIYLPRKQPLEHHSVCHLA